MHSSTCWTHNLTPCQKPAFPTSLAPKCLPSHKWHRHLSAQARSLRIILFFFTRWGRGACWGGRNHSWLLFFPYQQLYLSNHQVLLIPTPQVSHRWVHFSSCPFIHPFTNYLWSPFHLQGVILGAAVNVANIRLATLGSCLHGIIHCLVKEIFSKTNSYKRNK